MRHCDCCKCMHRRLFPKPALTYRTSLERIPVLDRSPDQRAYIDQYDVLEGHPDQFEPMMMAIIDWIIESQ